MQELPTIVEAIMSVYDSPNNIDVHCLKCDVHMRGFLNERPPLSGYTNVSIKPNKAKLKKYVKKFYGCDDSFILPVGR